MKCPVCDREIIQHSEEKIKCELCGFDDIRTEFINEEEKLFWETYVVSPCRYAYRIIAPLRVEVGMLRREIKKMSLGNTTANGSFASAPPEAKVTMIDGWNYDDPIAHPNSAVGKYYQKKYSISNIEARMTSSSTAIVTFFAKKLADDEGNHSTSMFSIRYRVKDKNGIILLNETKGISGLQVGDVSKETIKLTGVTAGEYVIDFVSYN